MMNNNSAQSLYLQWQHHCSEVQSATTVVKSNETAAQKKKRIARLLGNYSAFVEYYFPHWLTNPETGKLTACAPFHIAAANQLRKERNIKVVAEWARGHAKSTHYDVFIPMLLMALGEIHVIVIVGKSFDNACELLSDIQAELECNQRYIADFGTQKKDGSWQVGSFVTANECAFFARGRGQSPRGLRYRSHRPDYIVIDDLDDDELVNNPDRVSKLTKWVKEALFGALDGGRGRFVMVGNLIGKCSVLANIANSNGVKVTRVNALLPDGTPSWSTKWTREEIDRQAEFMGYISFQREMMNNPITEGAIFKANWIQWIKPLPLNQYADIIVYCDPSFKSSGKNDFKAVKVWAKTKEGQLHHLRAFVRQTSVAEMVRWFYDTFEWIHREGAVASFYIEANFLQDILLEDFRREGVIRGYQLPIRPDKRKKPDKYQRIESISPLWERGFVYYADSQRDNIDMLAGIDQTLSFEKGMSGHDDAPDADEGAIYLLQRHSITSALPPLTGRRPTPKNNW